MNNHRNILSTLSATALATRCRIQQLPGTERWYDCSYDATGTKLRTVHTIPSVPPAVPMEGGSDDESIVTTTDYSGGYIYENGTVDRLLITNGFVTFAADGTPAYHYYLKDYLGNVRAVISHDGSVEQTAHYYPFGSLMATTEYQPEVTHPNRYLYGGKELDRTSGLDLLDFEARAYDPLLPRFRSMDPLCEDFTHISPYAYCANNPFRNIDPTGMNLWEVNEDGKVISMIETDEYDRIVVVDSDGNPKTDEDGNEMSVTYEYGTINHKKFDAENGESYDIFTVRGDDNGKSLFEFFSNNISRQSQVEFSLVQTGYEGAKGLNFVNTSHAQWEESAMPHLYNTQLKYGYWIRTMNHTHPNSANPSRTDLKFKDDINKDQKRNITQYIFHVPSQTYINF